MQKIDFKQTEFISSVVPSLLLFQTTADFMFHVCATDSFITCTSKNWSHITSCVGRYIQGHIYCARGGGGVLILVNLESPCF